MKYDDEDVVYNDVTEELSRTYFIMKDGSELQSKKVIESAEAYLTDGDAKEISTKLYALAQHARDPLSFMIGYIAYAKLVTALNDDIVRPSICVDSESVGTDDAMRYMALTIKRRSEAQVAIADKVLAKLGSEG